MQRLKILAFILLLLITTAALAGAHSAQKMTPIYDGKDGLLPPLRLQNCLGRVQVQDGAYGLSSRTITRISEVWYSGPVQVEGESSRLIEIRLWYFDNAADIPYFPTIPGKVMGSVAFPGWDRTAEFGDRSLRINPARVLFSKGNVLVDISLGSLQLARSGSIRSHVDAVARKVEAAIHEGVNWPRPRS